MSTGTWFNNDGLYLQYGTLKAVPDLGGDFLYYGENCCIEQYLPLVPTTWGTGNVAVGAPPTSFSGTSTPIAAGIQSMTTLLPLQLTAPQTASGSALILSNTQIFIERIELECLKTVAPLTNTINIGLVTTNPASPSTFVQVTPNAGGQLLGTDGSVGTALGLTAVNGSAGAWSLYNGPNYVGTAFHGGVPVVTVGTAGAWIGTDMPLVTNSIVPLPTSAWISTIASGAFTAGLLKLRMKYFIYGNISY